MTRINIIDPSLLMDQHLIAEYREIRLLAQNLKRSFNSKVGLPPSRIPKQFTLNKGHVLFFADKGKYIQKRYVALQQEMKARGFNPQFPNLDVSAWPPEYFKDWTPTDRDCEIVRERIALRISQRPGWYRKTKAIYPHIEILTDFLNKACIPYEDMPEGQDVVNLLAQEIRNDVDEEVLQILIKS